MSIARAKRRVMAALVGVIFWAGAGIAMATQDEPTGTLGLLMRGSVQAVLSVCLLATTTALGIAFKLLVSAYQDRIAALEKAVAQSATNAAASATLAAAMDRLREHCEGKFRG